MTVFIDTHTHCTDEAFAGCEEEVVARAVVAGVTKMLLADIDSKERTAMYALAEKHPGVLFPMIGLYPGSVTADWQKELDIILEWKEKHGGIVAVGEIGLDFHFSTDFAEQQKDAFKAQLELASQWDLPVNIHLRDATDAFFDVLDSCRNLTLRGNLHAFSGSKETFRRLSRYGDWSVGIGGVLTFKKASIAEDIKYIPMENILLETDAPYLAPTPLRGTRNESANIPLIALKLAEIKGLPLEEVARITTANAERLFDLRVPSALN